MMGCSDVGGVMGDGGMPGCWNIAMLVVAVRWEADGV